MDLNIKEKARLIKYKIKGIGKQYDLVEEFREGYAVISGWYNYKWWANLIDKKGRKLLPDGKYKEIKGFYDGLALCIIESEIHDDVDYDRYLVEYVDTTGEVVIGPLKCAHTGDFYQGRAIIRNIEDIKYVYFDNNESYHFIDKKGNKIDDKVTDSDFLYKYSDKHPKEGYLSSGFSKIIKKIKNNKE